MESLTRKFEKEISEFPAVTKVNVDFRPVQRFIKDTPKTIFSETVEIETKKVFIKGDWLARRFSGVNFNLIIKELDRLGVTHHSLERWVSVVD